ncbi:UPF0489 family protein [Mycobacterium sp.]|uniref:UPF0489 family protein n=1 Tax=Mycobacterium sp. TaxID=1785 RepID=UPI00120B212F|nr:UPF0489 family protein [Mycobacterium sp.]TAM69149.1 MAG: hypothetical protein EPN51_09710 [Mycobacterium sp.]
MQRVLDIDLDFFVTPPVYRPGDTGRPSPTEYSVQTGNAAFDFLRHQCGLQGPVRGFLTETHDQLFLMWRKAIADGILVPPFHVTHVDAHADLGNGDNGYAYVMTSLLFSTPEERQFPSPAQGEVGLTEVNFLLFAIACRWINSLEYVYGPGGGSDEIAPVMRDFDLHANAIRLAAMTKKNLSRAISSGFRHNVAVEHFEPEIPYEHGPRERFYADSPYDFVCLTRSPLYTPSTADPLYDAIVDNFIDPI